MKFALVLLVFLFISSSSAAIQKRFNSDFTIYYDDETGLFTVSATTSAGKELPILFGADSTSPMPLTSYISISSSSTEMRYITGVWQAAPKPNSVDPMQPVYTLGKPTSVDSTGGDHFVLTYEVSGEFIAVVRIALEKPSLSTGLSSKIQSSVSIKTTITSLAAGETTYGIHYVLDYAVDIDDGPTFRTISEASSRQHYARYYTDPKFDYYMLESNLPIENAYTVVGAVNVPETYLLAKERGDYSIVNQDVSSSIHDVYGYLFTVSPSNLAYTAMEAAYQLAWAITTFNDHDLSASVAQGFDMNHRGVYDPFALRDDSGVVHSWSIKLAKDQKDYAETSFFVLQTVDRYTTAPGRAGVSCNDGYACTYDYFVDVDCFDSECIHLPVHQFCNDKNPCTWDLCDQSSSESDSNGCTHIEKNCDDEVPCTFDYCDPVTGECVHDDSAGASKVTCDDHNPCTKDSCDKNGLGKCLNEPDDSLCVAASLGDKCNTHYCDPRPGEGCAKRPVNCDDDILCTVDSCEPATGCKHEADDLKCDDKIACTVDVCDTVLGKCMNYPTNTLCDDQDPCTTDYCDVYKGCVHIPMECFMSDLSCTLDYCINGYCLHVADDSQCNDNVACTVDHCNLRLSECTIKPNHAYCDDGKFCTDDYCDVTKGCQHTEHMCDDGIPCSIDKCDTTTQKCTHDFTQEAVVCDDGIACTNDICSKDLAKCLHQPIHVLCDDYDACTTDYCDPYKGCIHEQKYCNDENPCTVDKCIAGSCVYTNNTAQSAMVCDDDVYCTDDRCDSHVGCINVPLDHRCNDNIDCTDDVCTGANCTNTPNDFNCDDQIPCTIDTCDKVKGCLHTPVHEICDDRISSTQEFCSEIIGCIFTLDQEACAQTYDRLVVGGCARGVATYEGCTIVYDDSLCSDNVTCTENKCGADGMCTYIPDNSKCSDAVGCTDDVCDPVKGCVHKANALHCSDGRSCTVEICDEQYGCIIEYTSLCPANTKAETCLNCVSPRSRIGITDYEDGSADFRIQTRLDPIVPFATVSTKGLTENMVIKNAGAIVFGQEEYVSNDDGVVIGANSGLRLVPSISKLPNCNEVSRGTLIVKESEIDSTGSVRDHVYICLREDESYSWVRYA